MLYFILGVLVWQSITMIVFLTTNENEGKTAICGSLIPFSIIWGICQIIRNTIAFVKYYNVRAVLVCPDSEWRYCKSKDAKFFECSEGYNFPNWTEELKQKYPSSLWKEDKRKKFFGVGNLRYSPKQIWINFKPINKKEIKLARKNYLNELEKG